MRPPLIENNNRCPAPCQGARRLLIIAISVSLLLVLTITVDQSLRVDQSHDGASVWMKAMHLSTPALWTAGSPMRHPEMLHPGVDLRFSAGLVNTP